MQDVIFHNEAYIRSNSSIEGSPEKVSANKQSEPSSSEAQLTQSPKRGASFVSAVINAIQSATVGTTTKQLEIQNEGITEVTDSVLEGMQLLNDVKIYLLIRKIDFHVQ